MEKPPFAWMLDFPLQMWRGFISYSINLSETYCCVVASDRGDGSKDADAAERAEPPAGTGEALPK
jgi:hypothetical protein